MELEKKSRYDVVCGVHYDWDIADYFDHNVNQSN